jgi:thiol-disulfide isomerase/thioredoxin
LIVCTFARAITSGVQATPDSSVIAQVHAAIDRRDFARGEAILDQYRAARPVSPDIIEAWSDLARTALASKQLDKANRYAGVTYDLVEAAVPDHPLADDAHLRTALATAIETHALVLVEQGARSEAVSFLQSELETYRTSSLRQQIQGDIDRLSLEGRPALRLEGRLHLGPRVPSADEMKGRVVLMFFWAHWCADCKADVPTVARVVEKYRKRGLTIIAPTRRYGVGQGGRPASPDKELRHLIDVRDTYYSFLRDEPVPVSEVNYEQYGVASIPMYVVIDKEGVIRLYHAGRMTEEDLEGVLQRLF